MISWAPRARAVGNSADHGAESQSPNITSHPKSGIGQWSDDEIKRALTQGIARDGRKLKPPMAYAAYATMTAEDQDAIVAFLRTIPAIE